MKQCTYIAIDLKSLSNGQVLSVGYDYKKTKVVVMEMADEMSMNLVKHHLVTDQIVLTINYDAEERAKERKMQEALLEIKAKFGKNAILKGLNFEEGATAMERNQQIGGHKA